MEQGEPGERDDCLVTRARAGESEAFGRIVARYHELLLCTARACLGRVEEAADAVQDTWVLAYLHLNQLQAPTRLGPWLRRVTLNVCRQRARSRRETLPLEALPDLGADPTRMTEERLFVEQALECLSPQTRLTVTLFYHQSLSVEEIARFRNSRSPPSRAA